jgi:hypothetical protein
MASLINVTNRKEKSPLWEANSRQVVKKTARVLLGQKVHYFVHNSLNSVPLPSQTKPVFTLQIQLFKIHYFNITMYTPTYV